MTNKRIEIKDDFLNQTEFDDMQKIMIGSHFPWFFHDFIDDRYVKTKGEFQFIHLFYQDGSPTTDSASIINPIIKVLKPLAIYRIKANLLVRLPTIVENTFHTDIAWLSEEKQKQWTTSIFYMNTNNGYTIFEDGTKVESVANRMLTFPANMKHTGTSCTDENTRVVINFNYITK